MCLNTSTQCCLWQACCYLQGFLPLTAVSPKTQLPNVGPAGLHPRWLCMFQAWSQTCTLTSSSSRVRTCEEKCQLCWKSWTIMTSTRCVSSSRCRPRRGWDVWCHERRVMSWDTRDVIGFVMSLVMCHYRPVLRHQWRAVRHGWCHRWHIRPVSFRGRQISDLLRGACMRVLCRQQLWRAEIRVFSPIHNVIRRVCCYLIRDHSISSKVWYNGVHLCVWCHRQWSVQCWVPSLAVNWKKNVLWGISFQGECSSWEMCPVLCFLGPFVSVSSHRVSVAC